MASPVLIVGLGNPGSEYASTRHNAGAMALAELADRMGLGDAFKAKFHGEIASGSTSGRAVALLRPETFMNDSGRSVAAAASFFRVSPADVIVLHDELDLPFGQVRIKVAGGHAGHNGLRSVMSALGSADFVRVRMGIGRPPAVFTGDIADYVLSGFNAAERVELPALQKLTADAVLSALDEGVTRVMNRLNARPVREAVVKEGGAAGPTPAAGKIKAAAP